VVPPSSVVVVAWSSGSRQKSLLAGPAAVHADHVSLWNLVPVIPVKVGPSKSGGDKPTAEKAGRLGGEIVRRSVVRRLAAEVHEGRVVDARGRRDDDGNQCTEGPPGAARPVRPGVCARSLAMGRRLRMRPVEG
jgi:hypothetical protein